MKKVCMIVQDRMVKGGIAAVIDGYYNSKLEKDYKMIYVESYKDGGKLGKLVKGIYSYICFIKVLLIDKPDLIHVHSSFGPSFYRKLPFIYMSFWMNKPIINHIHGADFNKFYLNATKGKKKLVKKVYSKCTKLIALSDEWKEYLSKIVPNDKIVVIKNYSILHEDALNERINRKSNNIVLFLGELGKRKGCYDIPYIVERVVERIPSVKFILAGAGAEMDEKAIKSKIISKGVDKNVIFPGWVRNEEKDRLLRKADVFILPSYNEGMPMSILDAMGYGLPIISTNVGGISNVVINDKNGYCCNPGDIETISDNIIKILTNSNIRKNAAINNFEMINKYYSLNMHLDLIENLYSNTI